jgi:hypothetical protein
MRTQPYSALRDAISADRPWTTHSFYAGYAGYAGGWWRGIPTRRQGQIIAEECGNNTIFDRYADSKC